jgi:hypothetical protein
MKPVLVQAVGHKSREAIVWYKLFIFEYYQKTEEENRKRGLQIAVSGRKQNAGYNHMKDKVENERILNPTGKMQ